MVLSTDDSMKVVFDYLDSITFSIDSIDSRTNRELGRGADHWNNIRALLDYLKDKDIKVNINTVATRENIGKIEELGRTLEGYPINAWRIFKFMPLRETAEINRGQFEITDAEYQALSDRLQEKFKGMKIETRQEQDMEDKYVLLVANGDIIKTENGVDVKKGNALHKSVMDVIQGKDNIRERIKVQPKAPNLVVIGNIAYDIIDFSRLGKARENIVDIGGACVFSSIPASLYGRVRNGWKDRYRF